MFEYLADDIAIFLIQRNFIDDKDRDLYCYGAEVFFLNTTNIIMAFLISFLSKTWSHFLIFMLVFVPLRISIGGYHAKTSRNCFVQSVLLYIASVLVIKYSPNLYQNPYSLGLFSISVILIFIFAPIEHKNNALNKKAKKKNKTASILLVSADSIIFVVLTFLESRIASSVMTFIILAALLMIIGKVYNSFHVK